MGNSQWDAIVSLLRLDYPCITRAKLQAMLGGGTDKDEYLTTGEAARLLRCSARSLKRWRDAGRISCAKVSKGKVLYSRNDLARTLSGDA